MRSNRGSRQSGSEPTGSLSLTDGLDPSSSSNSNEPGSGHSTDGAGSGDGTGSGQGDGKEPNPDEQLSGAGSGDGQAPGGEKAPAPIDASKSDDELLTQFRAEAIEHHYDGEAADAIAQGRLRHLRAGGDGNNVLAEGAQLTPPLTPPAPPKNEPVPGLARLKAPLGATSVSHRGGEYTVDESGYVEVPEEHIAHLFELGFRFGEE